MSHKTVTIITVFTALIIVLAMIGSARAQMDNKPFSFRNSPGGGPGMSTGGRQAILNEKIFGSSPRNLQRGPDGRLLDVTRGPRRSAIVSFEGDGGFIPRFRGTSFRGDNPFMQVGIFNGFFGPSHDRGSFSYNDFQTTSIINSWVMSVAQGDAPAHYYGGGSTIDSWTLFVHSLNGLNSYFEK